MLLFLKGLFLFLKGVFLFSSVFEVFVLFQKFRCKFCFYFWGIKKCQMYRIRNTKFNKIAQGGGAQTTLGVGWKFKIFVKLCYFCTFLKFVLKNLVPLHLWGYLTFRILSLLRYVVDIIKSNPNPIFLKIQWKLTTGGLPKFNSWTFVVFLDNKLCYTPICQFSLN